MGKMIIRYTSSMADTRMQSTVDPGSPLSTLRTVLKLTPLPDCVHITLDDIPGIHKTIYW